MAVKTASTAELRFNGSAIAKVRDVTLNINRDALDTTGIGQPDRTYVEGIRSSSGSGTLMYDDADTATRNIMNRILADSSGTSQVDLIIDNSTSLGNISGSVVITQVGLSVSVGDLVNVPISFNFSGKPSGSF
jgi:sporulation protein YlmC with PRC-barrel domain